MKSFLFFVLFLLSSCSNIQHLTNSNISDLQGLSTNQTLRMKYDAVNTITADEAAKCQSVGKLDAKDNALDTGEKYAILYVKAKALELKADSVIIEKVQKVGEYGHHAFGEGFKCKI